MMKFLKEKIGWLFFAVGVLTLPALYTFADYTLPQPGTALTVFGFTCFSSKTCPGVCADGQCGRGKGRCRQPGVRNACCGHDRGHDAVSSDCGRE